MLNRSKNSVGFLTDWQIGDALMRIIREARQRLILVSPYNKHWGHLRREIVAAQQRGVEVTIYYRSDEANPVDDYDAIAAVPVRMLHAKIYANESSALVSSMNLLESSAMYSRDVGLLVRGAKLRREIDEYVKSLADGTATGSPFVVGVAARNGSASRQQVQTASDMARVIDATGFCIECGDPVSFALDKPLCRQCYDRFGRVGTHNRCHRCGEPHAAQVGQPLCQSCLAARTAGG